MKICHSDGYVIASFLSITQEGRDGGFHDQFSSAYFMGTSHC